MLGPDTAATPFSEPHGSENGLVTVSDLKQVIKTAILLTTTLLVILLLFPHYSLIFFSFFPLLLHNYSAWRPISVTKQ